MLIKSKKSICLLVKQHITNKTSSNKNLYFGVLPGNAPLPGIQPPGHGAAKQRLARRECGCSVCVRSEGSLGGRTSAFVKRGGNGFATRRSGQNVGINRSHKYQRPSKTHSLVNLEKKHERPTSSPKRRWCLPREIVC